MEGVVFMKALVFSDLHGYYASRLPKKNPDIVFILGDISWSEVRNIDEMYKCPKFGVLGNHDRPDLFEGTSIVNLHGKMINYNGIVIAGFGGCPVYNSRNYGQYREVDASRFVDSLSSKVNLFISHSNAQFSANLNFKDSHRGFSSFAKLIEKHKPAYFLHGHLHENTTQMIEKTSIICTYGFSEIELYFKF